MSGVVLGNNNITINGRIIETYKSNGVRETLPPIAKTQAEILTGVNGWIKVKHLPIGSTLWYQDNNNLAGTVNFNHTTKLYTQEWAITWSNKNEFLFTRGDFENWLYDSIANNIFTPYGDGWSGGHPVSNTNYMTALATSYATNNLYTKYINNDGLQFSPAFWYEPVVYDTPTKTIYQERQTPTTNFWSFVPPTITKEYGVWVRNSNDTQSTVQPIAITGTDFKYISFVNTGENQTKYNITFNEHIECDILVVGGGGAGGKTDAGGGGAGGLIYETGLFLNGNYNILVGKGGNINNAASPVGIVGQNGTNTIISNTLSFNKVAIGGGGGGSGYPNDIENSTTGGSSGGLGTSDRIRNIGFTTGQGNQGGLGAIANGSSDSGLGDGGGGGGGGAGGAGFDSPNGNGGVGRQIDITGTNTYYAGGGGGGHGNNSLGGLGGGGAAFPSGNGSNATFFGGGGGGGGGSSGSGGSGFAGIVIIRYKIIITNYEAQWTYSASTPNVYHLGNVGIGTTNPTSALHVLGSVQVNGAINATSLTANTKNFKIEHPLNINKWLYHGCVESPRFDNIYRGKKKIINGRGEVDIDEECNTTGGMTKGTFVALNTNFSLYVRNNQTYDRVYGIINGEKITINCNNTEEIEIDWLVIGERKDENIISNKLTNNEGNLICEHDMD